MFDVRLVLYKIEYKLFSSSTSLKYLSFQTELKGAVSLLVTDTYFTRNCNTLISFYVMKNCFDILL